MGQLLVEKFHSVIYTSNQNWSLIHCG